MTTAQAYLDQLVQIHGDASQRERWRAGRLSEEELRALARDALFEPLRGFPRFERIEAWGLRHKAGGCTFRPDALTFSSGPWAGPLSRVQWEHVKKLRAAVALIQGEKTASERYHECACTCSARKRELSFLVTVPWTGSPLSREYAL